MTIDAFLEQFVEGYLFGDLESMATLPNRGKYGNCGYSMVMDSCSGIELFGALIHSEGRNKGDNYFVNFWRDCVYPHDEPRRGLGLTVRKLVRDGIGHIFLPTPNVLVTKEGHRDEHLSRDASGRLIVDALVLFDDLKRSYAEHITPRLQDPARRGALQTRLDRIQELATNVAENDDYIAAIYKAPEFLRDSAFRIQPSGEGPVNGSPGCNSPAWPAKYSHQAAAIRVLPNED